MTCVVQEGRARSCLSRAIRGHAPDGEAGPVQTTACQFRFGQDRQQVCGNRPRRLKTLGSPQRSSSRVKHRAELGLRSDCEHVVDSETPVPARRADLVERGNADTDELRARNVLQSSRAGWTAACGCYWVDAKTLVASNLVG